MTFFESKKAALENPTLSYWLRQALLDLDDRDILDAYADVKFLSKLLDKKMAEMGFKVKKP